MDVISMSCTPNNNPSADTAAQGSDTPVSAVHGPWDPDVESDGLTVDTPLGPVDLVVIDRVIRGHHHALTLAEDAWLHRRHGPIPVRRQAAEKLGTPHARFAEHLHAYFDDRRGPRTAA
jgi:hypothetical protein